MVPFSTKLIKEEIIVLMLKYWYNRIIIYVFANFLGISLTIMLFEDVVDLPKSIFLSFTIVRLLIGIFLILVFIEIFKIQLESGNLSLLIIAGFLFLVSYFLETYSFLLVNSTKENYVTISKIYFNFAQTCITFAPLLFMYFVITFFKSETRFFEYLPVIFDVVLETNYQILGITTSITTIEINSKIVKYWIYDPDYFWINIVYYLSITWLVLYLSYLIIQSRKISIEPIVREQQNIFLIGIITIFIISPLVFISNILLTSEIIRFYWIAIINRSFIVVGMTIFILAFYRSSERIDFFQPQPLEAFFLLDANTGEILYEKKFILDYNWGVLQQIVTNVTIINKMLGDALGITTQITGIDFIDKELIIDKLSNLDQISILILRYETKIIKDNYRLLLNQLSLLDGFKAIHVETLLQNTFRI